MNISRQLQRLALNEDINFLLTNRVPRAALTRFMGWFSRIRHPWVRAASMAVWRTFTDIDLSEAKKSSFHSLHDCFVRELKPGLRPVDPRPEVLASPCDAIVGACGRIGDDPGAQVFQAKGFPYPLTDLLGPDPRARAMIDTLRGGSYVTLRDLIEWTSKDAVRFFLLSRKPDTEYTFDVDLAVQKNNDNPVYYVQYLIAN